MLVMQNNPSRPILILLSVSLMSGTLAGCVTHDRLPGDALAFAEDTSDYGIVEFEGEFDQGAVAFLIDLAEQNRSRDNRITHMYLSKGSGATDEHLAAMLVPTDYLEKNDYIDLRPGDINNFIPDQSLDHVYVPDYLWTSAHTASYRSSDDHFYKNLNDEGYGPLGSGEVWNRNIKWGSFPEISGLHWLIFTATTTQTIKFTLTQAEILEGPLTFDSQVMRLLTTDEEFESELWVSSMPVHGAGATVTTGATTAIDMEGPVFTRATLSMVGDPENLDLSVTDPQGRELEMRQKYYGAMGVIGPGVVVGHEVINTEAEILSPLDGEWTVEIGEFTGFSLEFRLFVLSFQELVEYQKENLG